MPTKQHLMRTGGACAVISQPHAQGGTQASLRVRNVHTSGSDHPACRATRAAIGISALQRAFSSVLLPSASAALNLCNDKSFRGMLKRPGATTASSSRWMMSEAGSPCCRPVSAVAVMSSRASSNRPGFNAKSCQVAGAADALLHASTISMLVLAVRGFQCQRQSEALSAGLHARPLHWCARTLQPQQKRTTHAERVISSIESRATCIASAPDACRVDDMLALSTGFHCTCAHDAAGQSGRQARARVMIQLHTAGMSA